ncbi:hypothetical protein AB0M61_03785 [Streptomyces sp. NPDC051642]|uniref:hypothetical protein n=1 Tax=Streptomyces sp. NPDC051642 TaxID=3154646 RepID=UPI00341B73BD
MRGGHCLLAVPKALSRQQGDPAAACPFDVGHSGFVMAEGAAVLVLERAEFARARGTRGYGAVAGAAVTSSARHIPASNTEGQVRAIQTALWNAELEPADIGRVHDHAVWAARRPARPIAPSTTARTLSIPPVHLGSSSRTHVTINVEDTCRNPRKRHA